MGLIKFTQGHFEALAEALQEAKRTAQNIAFVDDETRGRGPVTDETRAAWLDGIAYAQGEIARMSKRSNGQFDAGRFARACELGANVRNKTR